MYKRQVFLQCSCFAELSIPGCSVFLYIVGAYIFRCGTWHPLVFSQRILASGSCQIDHAIDQLEGPEAYDTAMVMVEFDRGRTAVIDVCRQAPYG